LVRTVRTAKGPRQELVANLGKAPGLEEGSRRGWEEVAAMLEGRPGPAAQGELGKPLAAAPAQWVQVDLRGVRVERVREFGEVYLALALWRRLGLHQLLSELIEPGRESVCWELVACILSVARFCGNLSELEVAEHWYGHCALEDLLAVSYEQVNESRLYRGLDVLLKHKERLCQHLLKRYESWFKLRFEFLLYDVTSTYFEGQAMANVKAKRGYSRDKRPDCKQVNIGLVVTPEGLPIAYEVFPGNTADVTTVEQMVQTMESKYGQAERIWVMDRGMVSEGNLEFLRKRRAHYIIGTPKSQLKRVEAQLLEQEHWSTVEAGVEVKLVSVPEAEQCEQFVLCRSEERRKKEAAMLELKRSRLLAQLEKINAGLKRRPAKDTGAVERRIGRALGRYPGAEKLLEIALQRDEQGRASGLEILEKGDRSSWAQLAHGAYLLRTNCTERDPGRLWKWYVQLNQAEECFRISKSDLNLRPLFHQKTERVEAHILVCFLNLAMWRTLEMWMKSKALGDCARQLVKEVATLRSMDVILPVRNSEPSMGTTELRLRVVARPERKLAELLQHLGLELPQAPRIVENVVEKNSP
jgi:transposase